jgi:hypothetical protein
MARAQKSAALQKGATQARRAEIEGRRVGAAAQAAITATGVNPTEGSVANIPTASEIAATIDADRARANAARAAWGFEAEEEEYLYAGRRAEQAGVLGSLGAGLSGIGTAGRSLVSYYGK